MNRTDGTNRTDRTYAALLAIVAWLMVASWAGAVTLAWDPSIGATGYRLYYGTESGSYGATVDAGTSTRGTVDGLIPGQTYFFAVSAYNDFWESALSEEISFTPAPLPPPRLMIGPQLVTVTLEGSQSVTGQWTFSGSTQGFFRAYAAPSGGALLLQGHQK